MWILILTVYAVMMSNGSIVPLDPPKSAVLESYGTLKTCDDDRIRVTELLALSDREDEGKTYHLECKPAKKPQI